VVLIWIGIAIGVLLAIILIVKVSKTNPHDVVGIEMRCEKCGLKTDGLACPRCKSNSFGV
jgi:predicted Zn-ribbon and HTH transcriptional regulator